MCEKWINFGEKVILTFTLLPLATQGKSLPKVPISGI
jgi:hypothetical protein